MSPYWLATGLLGVIFLTLFPTPIESMRFLKSPALIPYWPDNGDSRPLPFLWVGWTLLYEMMFYAWFGLFLGLPHARALVAVAAALSGLIIAGIWVPPFNAFLFAVTRPVSMIFVAGMILACYRSGGAQAAPPLRWLALGASVAAVWLIPAPSVPGTLGWDHLGWCGVPAVLIAVAALGGPLPLYGVRCRAVRLPC